VLAAASLVSGGVMVFATLQTRADRRAVVAMPLQAGNPVAFLDLASEGEEPIGRLLFQLRADAAPRAAENFAQLCTHARGFGYRRSAIHGLERGRRLLGGDFYGSGAGSFGAIAESFEDEPGGLALRHLGPGTLAMRSSGPHSNGSQFYISLRRLPELDGRSVVVGYAADAETLDVLERVARDFAGEESRIKKGRELRVQAAGILSAEGVLALRARREAAGAS